jgi:hypothetical protein
MPDKTCCYHDLTEECLCDCHKQQSQFYQEWPVSGNENIGSPFAVFFNSETNRFERITLEDFDAAWTDFINKG